MLRDPLYLQQLKLLFRDASLLLCCCDAFRQRFIALGCSPKKVAVQHYGVDLARFLHVKRAWPTGNGVTFLHASRFSEKKGIDYLILAFAKLLQRMPAARLRLVGTGDVEPKMRALVTAQHLDGRVVFVGKVPFPAMRQEFAQGDIFVHPSITADSGDTEGMPTAIMEAMATGLPVIGTIHAGIPELLDGGRFGRLVPERDVDALADAMFALASSRKSAPAYPRQAGSESRALSGLRCSLKSFKATTMLP